MISKYKLHPWHGVDIGLEAPQIVSAFIEIVPTDTVKYEVDKPSGYLKIDRPQKFSNVIPTLYGFIPQTYCAENIAELAAKKSGKNIIKGDGDPLDICVLSEHTIAHGDILLKAIPIGGFRLIDKGEADDKIIAVMKGDEFYESWKNISDCPPSFINRLKHYFLTYKNLPGEKSTVDLSGIYNAEEAQQVIIAAQRDYKKHFGLSIQ